MTPLAKALREKFRTPSDAIHALGLDENLITGRAGPDVVAGDSKENLNMTKSALARKKAFDALAAFVTPKLAKDQKLDGLDAILLALDAEPDDDKEKKAAEEKEAADKKAKDEAEEAEKAEKKAAADKGAKDKKGMDRKARDEAKESFKEKLKGQMKAEDWKAACDDIDGMMGGEDEAETEEEKKAREAKEAKDKKGMDEEEVKKAMDEAIAGERARQRGIREAEHFVRTRFGNINLALDSANDADVYKHVLEAHGRSTKGIPAAAYRAMCEMLPAPGSERRIPDPVLGMDASNFDAATKYAPGLARITQG